jgi:hypothetical protein
MLGYPLEPGNPLVADIDGDLLWDSFNNPADLGKNVFRRAGCESGCLGLQVAKQEEVAGCTFWRMGRMDNPVGFGSDNLLSRPFGIAS